MEKNKVINITLSILALEVKKMKKKKGVVAVPPIRRPLGSTFTMDAVVSESEMISESMAIKPVPTKFNNLKWKLNDYQKSFLDEFISTPDEALKEDDYKYASKYTGIPLNNIKSIKNTYAEKALDSYYKPDVVKGSRLDAAHNGVNAVELGLGSASSLPKKSSKTALINPNPHFRGKSLGEENFNDGGTISRTHERELPGYMYEWVMYFIEGSEKFKIHESKVMEHTIVYKRKKSIVVEIISEEKLTDGFIDFASNKKTKETFQLEDILSEFNSMFGTNFIVENQYSSKEGNLVCVVENNQITDGKNTSSKKTIDMTFTDQKRLAIAMSVAAPPGNLPL